MSKFTGKSDFFDWCEMHNEPSKVVELAKVYMGDAKLSINSEKDLIPYYTHLITSMACSSDGQNIHLSKESFIDSEEKEHLSWRISTAIQYARKAKKEKQPFNYEYLKSQKDLKYDNTVPFVWKNIVSIINDNPDLIKEHISKDYREAEDYISNWLYPKYFYDVHDPMHNRMREEFVEFAEESGFSVLEKNGMNVSWTDGEFHPVFVKMCRSIDEYYTMSKNWG